MPKRPYEYTNDHALFELIERYRANLDFLQRQESFSAHALHTHNERKATKQALDAFYAELYHRGLIEPEPEPRVHPQPLTTSPRPPFRFVISSRQTGERCV